MAGLPNLVRASWLAGCDIGAAGLRDDDEMVSLVLVARMQRVAREIRSRRKAPRLKSTDKGSDDAGLADKDVVVVVVVVVVAAADAEGSVADI